MHSISFWKLSRPPNYDANVNKLYPYSEVPFIGEYNLVKIPTFREDLIDLVDYWGEGRIRTRHGNSGFPDCYNVNHHYQLVSNGVDRDRKIPNRIPVINYTNCDTSSYIKENSVKVVTVMGAPINKSCAKDIVRMIKGQVGKVIVYGFDENSADIRNLTDALKMKEIMHCKGYELTEEFQGMSLYDTHRAYLNLTELKGELYKNVTRGLYDNSIAISNTLEDSPNGSALLTEAVTSLLKDAVTDTIEFAHKLWTKDNAGKRLVNKHFPATFKSIFTDFVTILSKKNLYALTLHENGTRSEKQAGAEREIQSTDKVKWKLIPVWENNNIYFQFLNKEYQDYLKCEDNILKVDSKVSSNDNYLWSLEPFQYGDDVLFYIVNKKFNRGLSLESDETSGKYNVVLSTDSNYSHPETFGWFLSNPQ